MANTTSTSLERAIKLQREWSGLAAGKRQALSELEAYWRKHRADVKDALHEAFRDLFREGRNVQEVSNLTNNTNYSLLYNLKRDVGAGVPQRTRTFEIENFEDDIVELPDVEWEFHDHIGVHGWLIDTDRKYVKFYGQKGTPYEGDWAIVEAEDRVFVAGNLELNNSISQNEFDTKVKMLTELLAGNYTGPTRLVSNPYTN